jgi:hypothetical protein
MNLKQMIEDLPTACDWGAKRNSQGNDEYWGGYKVHWDVVCSGRFRRIPVSCLITSASVNDSQVALPLMTMSAERVRWNCDLMVSGLPVGVCFRKHGLRLRCQNHSPAVCQARP